MKKWEHLSGRGIFSCMLIPMITAIIAGGGTLPEEDREAALEVLVANEAVLEIPEEYPFEAVKAQTVLIRSRYRKRFEEGDTEEKLYLEMQQKKEQLGWQEKEFSKEMEICEKAAGETRKTVLRYCGEVVDGAYFLAGNGGTREGLEVFSDTSYGWLTKVENSCDLEGPYYLSECTISSGEVKNRLYLETGEKPEGDLEKQLEILSRDQAGYVMKIRVGNTVLSGERFRKLFGLSSSCFLIQFGEEEIRFVCQGVGHGFGLCQYGAGIMAMEGADYQEILQFYFPKAELACIDF